MKTKAKRFLSLALVVVMVLSLVGCSGKKSEEQTNTKGSTDSETAEGSTDSNFNETGMPIVDEPITLTVLTTRWGNMGDSFKENEFLKKLEEESNVKIEWQVQSLNDWSEQKGIMLASGELPDIIFGFQTFNDADIMNNLELFLPLDDLVENYMPNYKKALEEMPDLKKIATFPDGKMYSLSKNLPLQIGRAHV